MTLSAVPPADASCLQAVLDRAANGDMEAFATFYDTTSMKAFELARSMSVDFGSAEQLMQDSYALAWRSAAAREPRYSPLAWLLSIVYCTARAN